MRSLPVARPLSDFTGLRRTTNPRQRRPFQQQYSLREMPIYDKPAGPQGATGHPPGDVCSREETPDPEMMNADPDTVA